MQVLGCLPPKLTHMVNRIGPDTCLWVFVKGVPGKVHGPFLATAPTGINVIEGALMQFTAQAKRHFHFLIISPQKNDTFPGQFALFVPIHL